MESEMAFFVQVGRPKRGTINENYFYFTCASWIRQFRMEMLSQKNTAQTRKSEKLLLFITPLKAIKNNFSVFFSYLVCYIGSFSLIWGIVLVLEQHQNGGKHEIQVKQQKCGGLFGWLRILLAFLLLGSLHSPSASFRIKNSFLLATAIVSCDTENKDIKLDANAYTSKRADCF